MRRRPSGRVSCRCGTQHDAFGAFPSARRTASSWKRAIQRPGMPGRRMGPSRIAGRDPRRFCDCDGRSRATPAAEVIAVSIPVIRRPGSHPRKPLLGLRRKPGRLALAMFRMPLHAYRHDAGWLPATRSWSSSTPDARPASHTRPSRWCCATTRTHTRPSSAPLGAQTPTGFATSAPDRRPRYGSGASRLPRSTGSSPMTRPSTSRSSSAGAPAAATPAQHDPRLGRPP